MNKSLDKHLWELIINAQKANATEIAILLSETDAEIHITCIDNAAKVNASDGLKNDQFSRVEIKSRPKGHGLDKLFADCLHYEIDLQSDKTIISAAFPSHDVDIQALKQAFCTMLLTLTDIDFDITYAIKGENLAISSKALEQALGSETLFSKAGLSLIQARLKM